MGSAENVSKLILFQNRSDVALSPFNIFNRMLVALFAGVEYHELKHRKTEALKGMCPGIVRQSGRKRRNLQKQKVLYAVEPHGMAAVPVYSSSDPNNREVVGYMFSLFSWDVYLFNLLPSGVNGMQVVFSNSCGQAATYSLCGPAVS
jgi:hypothetical protein